MKGLILAAGPGRRLRPLTHTGPKHMLPIAGKPIIQYAIESLKDAGISDIGVVVGYMRKHIMDFLGDGSKFGVDITYILQEEPKGIAHAIQCAEDYVEDGPFMVYLGDNLIKSSLKNFARTFQKSEGDALIFLSKVRDPQRFAVAEMKGGEVIRVVEKPKRPASDFAVIGIYFFRTCVFDIIKNLKPSWRDQLEIADAIQGLINKGYNVKAERLDTWWADSGQPEDLLESNYFILDELQGARKGLVEENVQVRGRVAIMEGTTVKEGCKIRGPVYIGRDCEIGPNTFIGPYTSIEDFNTIIGGYIENSIILERSRIHIEGDAKITDSVIGRNTEVIDNPQIMPKGGLRLVVGENTRIVT